MMLATAARCSGRALRQKPAMRTLSLTARALSSEALATQQPLAQQQVPMPLIATPPVLTALPSDELLNKFINCMMQDGKKKTSERILRLTLENIKTRELARLRVEHEKAKSNAGKKPEAKDAKDAKGAKGAKKAAAAPAPAPATTPAPVTATTTEAPAATAAATAPVAAASPVAAAPVVEEFVASVDPVQVFKTAIENCKPVVGTTPVRKSGSVYQVPLPLPEKRRNSLAIKWLISAARGRKGKPMAERLYLEIMDAYHNEGNVIKKKIELHKTAEANRAYAHYRWM